MDIIYVLHRQIYYFTHFLNKIKNLKHFTIVVTKQLSVATKFGHLDFLSVFITVKNTNIIHEAYCVNVTWTS